MRPRFQETVDFLVALDTIRSMAGCFNGVCRVKFLVLERLFHKVSLYGLALVGDKLVGLREFIASVDLVWVERDAGDVALQEFSDIAHGSTNSTSYIEHMLVVSVHP